MRLRAKTRKPTGVTTHLIHGVGVVPPAEYVEIEQCDGGWFIFHLDKDGECQADDWHPSLDLAKEHAMAMYSILETDWVKVPDTST
jgi:hypothetical protein